MDKKTAQQEKAEKAKQLTNAYKAIFSTDQGRLVLADLEKNNFYHQSCFTPQSERITSFSLGQQAVILQIHNQINKKEKQ